MKVIPLSSNKIEIIAKEIEALSQNNIKVSNLVYDSKNKKFCALVYILPNRQVGEKSPKVFNVKTETLEKWKKEKPSKPQIKILKRKRYTEEEINKLNKFDAHQLIESKSNSQT